VDISGIDFPVLMLADPDQIPFLSGYGSVRTGPINNVEVAYEPDDKDDDEDQDEPALRLSTMVRRGWRLTNGHPFTMATSLQSLGEQAVTGVLLSRIPPSSVAGDRREATELAMAEGRDLGARIPGPPWVLRSLDLDGTAYALWVLVLDDDRFCLVADCGPIVLTGTGRHIDAWTFALSAVPAAQAQGRFREIDDDEIDDDDEPSDG
jgi:hypothetical protein